ncbi:hypothetical protein [Microbacterium rhizophilus]|uniref:hypothetical protein n=1 Tax=Microbacterium rhizophilus TaxID=3138934 RepID=UPI0031F0270F
MIRTDLGHGRGWLSRPAAESVLRIDEQLGRPADSNSAGRDPQEQQQMVDRMNAGGPFALPVGTSEHESGNAWDSDEWLDPAAAAVLEDNGWRRTALARGEWWHAEYYPYLDNHINDQEDDMNADQAAALKRIDDAVSSGKKGVRNDGTILQLVKGLDAKLEKVVAALPMIERVDAAIRNGKKGVVTDGTVTKLIKEAAADDA